MACGPVWGLIYTQALGWIVCMCLLKRDYKEVYGNNKKHPSVPSLWYKEHKKEGMKTWMEGWEWLVRRSVTDNIIQLTALNGQDSSLSVWLTSYPRTISGIVSSSLGWAHWGDSADPNWPPQWPNPPASLARLSCYCYHILLKERLRINHHDRCFPLWNRRKVDGQRRSLQDIAKHTCWS